MGGMLNSGYWDLLKLVYNRLGGIRGTSRFSAKHICLGNGWMLHNYMKSTPVNSSLDWDKLPSVSERQAHKAYRFCNTETNVCELNTDNMRDELVFSRHPTECQEPNLWVTNKVIEKFPNIEGDEDSVVDTKGDWNTENKVVEDTTDAPVPTPEKNKKRKGSDITENIFSLGPYNGEGMGDDMILPTFEMMNNGLWQVLGDYYNTYGGVSTHHLFESKWCSICLADRYRLQLSGKNQSKGPTVPGQNGKSTCSKLVRDGKYQFHGQHEQCGQMATSSSLPGHFRTISESLPDHFRVTSGS